MRKYLLLLLFIFVVPSAHALITIRDANLSTRDLYAILGVTRFDSLETIKKAYRRLVHKYHPDISSEPNAEEKFKEVSEAYEFLKITENRAYYDRLRRVAIASYRPPDFSMDAAPHPSNEPTQEAHPSSSNPQLSGFDLNTTDGLATWALTMTDIETLDVFEFIAEAHDNLPTVSERDILLKVVDLAKSERLKISNPELAEQSMKLLLTRQKFKQYMSECDLIMKHSKPKTRLEFWF